MKVQLGASRKPRRMAHPETYTAFRAQGAVKVTHGRVASGKDSDADHRPPSVAVGAFPGL